MGRGAVQREMESVKRPPTLAHPAIYRQLSPIIEGSTADFPE
jgi:hypothetical protein